MPRQAQTHHCCTSTFGDGAGLFLDGDNGTGKFGVSLTANNTITVDSGMYVANNNSQGNWVLTAPTVTLNDGGEIDTHNGTGPANLTIHTNNLNLVNNGIAPPFMATVSLLTITAAPSSRRQRLRPSLPGDGGNSYSHLEHHF